MWGANNKWLQQVTKEIKVTKYDFIIMAAAVADYTPEEIINSKIKKIGTEFNLQLVKTMDILKSIVSKSNAVKVGFALETENGEINAINKMKEKSLDYIILNYANEEGAGFGSDTNHIFIYSKDGVKKEFKKDTKLRLSTKILEYIINHEK